MKKSFCFISWKSSGKRRDKIKKKKKNGSHSFACWLILNFFFLNKSEFVLSIIINYIKPLVFKLDIAILFQSMKILKKRMDRFTEMATTLLPIMENSFLYKTEWVLSNIHHIITIYVEALVLELDITILLQFMKILKKRWEKKNHKNGNCSFANWLIWNFFWKLHENHDHEKKWLE